MDFFVFETTKGNKGKSFDLSDPTEKIKYFQYKAQDQIDYIKTYLDTNSFLAITLSKKGAGKGTYIKMFAEVVGEKRVNHISVGDTVRDFQETLAKGPDEEKQNILKFLKENYRGFAPLEEQIKSILVKQQINLFGDELILALIKYKLSLVKSGAIFLDGFPRNIDQVSYSLYMRDLMRFKSDPDFFVVLDVPESLIELRIKSRRICPICQTSRNPVTHLSKFVGLNHKNQVVLYCDNPACTGYSKEEMVEKVGDSEGLNPIRSRLDMEQEVIDKALEIHGVPKVLVKGTVPVSALKTGKVEKFELTPRANFIVKNGKPVNNPSILKLTHAVDGESYSLMPPAVVLDMIYQIHSILSEGENIILGSD